VIDSSGAVEDTQERLRSILVPFLKERGYVR